jgi:Protein of unknown function (DUF1566)
LRKIDRGSGRECRSDAKSSPTSESNTVAVAVFANRHFFFRNIDMKLLTSQVARIAIVAAIACSTQLNAQTCQPSIRASNPTNVYIIDTANGTVTDTRTGLMWDRCPRGQSGATCGTGSATGFAWAAATNLPAALGSYKGYSDWRLPNIKELKSLVEECRSAPTINEFVFPATPTTDVPLSSFWSGSPYAGGASSAWAVPFVSGLAYTGDRSSAFYVRLVRAGY